MEGEINAILEKNFWFFLRGNSALEREYATLVMSSSRQRLLEKQKEEERQHTIFEYPKLCVIIENIWDYFLEPQYVSVDFSAANNCPIF